MSKKNKTILKLTSQEANALMVMLESEIETIFECGGFDIDPIADWESVDLYAYKLLAYKTYKQWYMDNHHD